VAEARGFEPLCPGSQNITAFKAGAIVHSAKLPISVAALGGNDPHSLCVTGIRASMNTLGLQNFVADREGIEPSLNDLEALVLPLHQRSVVLLSSRII
jgi:hypothetical protein